MRHTKPTSALVMFEETVQELVRKGKEIYEVRASFPTWAKIEREMADRCVGGGGYAVPPCAPSAKLSLFKHDTSLISIFHEGGKAEVWT